MIFVTGDTHGKQDRFENPKWESTASSEDYLIICGDFGYIFFNNEKEMKFLDYLEEKPYTILFLDGNHENFPAIFAYPEEEWHGGTVHRIRKNILHLMRGQIFEIEGKTFFTMGGAYSMDKHMRTEGFSWWPEEIPTDAEYKTATKNLMDHHMQVDYILTHTAPKEMILRMGFVPDGHDMELTGYLEWLLYEVKFKHWYSGHFHEDREMAENFSALFYDVICIS